MSNNKSFSTETSERYSRALFEISKESGELEKVETDVKTFKSLIEKSLELKNFIHNPTHNITNQNNVYQRYLFSTIENFLALKSALLSKEISGDLR